MSLLLGDPPNPPKKTVNTNNVSFPFDNQKGIATILGRHLLGGVFSLLGEESIDDSSFVQWHPFSFFLGGCPTKNGLQGFPVFFPGSLNN